ncbi:Disease resistance protein RPS2 [Vitis vinifera]|uniref:Disease resistance protein RPS2 n=1 Tax=Vitis vinifera TaxID=29760 RepID=A0A438HU36_VITVI|nr:Disease resistance protein RPS2 [Vitis vinifera]
MKAQKSMEVACLASEAAWTLFQKEVGEETINSHPHILMLSKVVAQECKGLPLALITLGRAMAQAKDPSNWEKVIQDLRKFPAEISEDYEIDNEQLIELWIGEGFLSRVHDIHEARDQGRLKEVQEISKWKEAERMSLWDRNVENLPETLLCPNLKTLFVRECFKLKTIPSGFFQFIPLLRVLDLCCSHRITELPAGIGELKALEYLNLSATDIRELPIELKNLKNLASLFLDEMRALEIIPSGVILSLTSLKLFSMRYVPEKSDGQFLWAKA